jgi:hypothetical protein
MSVCWFESFCPAVSRFSSFPSFSWSVHFRFACSAVVHIATDVRLGSAQTASVHIHVAAPVSLTLLSQAELAHTLPCRECGASEQSAFVASSSSSCAMDTNNANGVCNNAAASVSASSASSASSSSHVSWRVCANSLHTLHVAVRDRLGRVFSSLSHWEIESVPVAESSASAAAAEQKTTTPAKAVASKLLSWVKKSDLISVTKTVVDVDGEFGPILGSFDVRALRPGRTALCIFMNHADHVTLQSSTHVDASGTSGNATTSGGGGGATAFELSTEARCSPSFRSKLQVCE